MSVSVVIPVKNGARFITEAVESACIQAEVGLIVVVDDGSTDGTVEVVRAMSDPRIVLIENTRQGVSAARNSGLDEVVSRGCSHAAASWVVFLDADDRLRSGAVSELLAGVDDDCVAVYGDYDRIDENGAFIGRRRFIRGKRKPSGDVLGRLLAGNFLVNGGVMLIRIDIFHSIGGFDETLRHCEDWHAFCRLAATGRIVWRPNAHVLDYRVHRCGTMMDSSIDYRRYETALERVFVDPLICGRFDSRRLARLRRRSEAHLRTYLACQTFRSGAYLRAIRQARRAIMALPSHAPKVVLRLVGAAAGI